MLVHYIYAHPSRTLDLLQKDAAVCEIEFFVMQTSEQYEKAINTLDPLSQQTHAKSRVTCFPHRACR